MEYCVTDSEGAAVFVGQLVGVFIRKNVCAQSKGILVTGYDPKRLQNDP